MERIFSNDMFLLKTELKHYNSFIESQIFRSQLLNIELHILQFALII